MAQDLIALLEEHFRETSQQITALRGEIASLREETSRRLERVEEEIRQTHGKGEGLRDLIQPLAAGMVNFDERLESFKGEVRRDLDTIRSLLLPLTGPLKDRVRALESWREARESETLDRIRQHFGLESRKDRRSRAE